MTDKFWIILIVINIKWVNGNSLTFDQVHHTNKKNWEAAFDECEGNGLEFDKNVLKDIGGLSNKEFWVGMAIYLVTTPWIEINGCTSTTDGQEVMKSPSIVLCQNKCESYPFFGYSESSQICVCQHDNGSPYGIANCVEENSIYLFVYKVYRGKVSGDDTGKCTTLYCKGGENRLKASSCDETNDLIASRCNDRSVVGWSKSYSTSKQSCLKRNQLLPQPGTYCRIEGHTDEATLTWTNVYRAEFEAKLTKAEAGTREPIYCLAGSFTGDNDNKELNFTRRKCDDRLEFVCRIGTASSTTSRKSVIAVEISKKGSSTTFYKDEASATTSSKILIATKTMATDANGSFVIGPVIGGIAGAITLLIVLFLMIFCKIRSCGFFKTANTDKQEVQFSTEIYEHSENSDVRTNATPISNELYGLAPITSNNTYAVVNKIKKNGLQTVEDNYTETSHGEYDRLNGVSKRRTDSKTNLYDSHAGIRNENDPTYDSSNHGGRKLQLDNDVYDHTDTVSTDGSDYGYSSTLKSEIRNENDIYDKTVYQ